MKKLDVREKKPPGRAQKPRNGNGGAGKLLGPVPNLEEHVRPDWWRRIFNSLYLKTDADVVDDAAITAHEADLFSRILELSRDEAALDLCCGQGRHALELASRGYRVEGMDRSHYLITRARTQARKLGLEVRFREGDARKLPYPADSFAVIMILGNSFGYFDTLEDDLRVLREVRRTLKPMGRLLIDLADGDFIRNNFQARSWEWIDRKRFVCRERSLSADGQRLISREVVTHAEKGVLADQFYAERLYNEQGVGELLEAAEFEGVSLHGGIGSDSKRNQDLGMMERRILVTARVRKEWARGRAAQPAVKNIVVVMGDPGRPDMVKPNCAFQENDFQTIDRLKEALARVEGCSFKYMNNHNTLMRDLVSLSAGTDLFLNLCDEGYDNDPRKELHVPALMEMLGLPFTGAGPQCLAFCYDKSLVRGVAKEMGVPVPEAFFIKSQDDTFEIPFCFPVMVKPNFGDSSFGITRKSVAWNHEELLNAVSEIRQKLGYDRPIIVEEFLPGKDLSVGVIGNPPTSYQVMPITEEDYSEVPESLPRICGYEAKWDPESPYWKIRSVPARLADETEKSIEEWCVKLFERLECRDYARFDWRLDAAGEPKLLEVNPNPGWCWDGHLAKMAAFGGLEYRQMLARIIEAAAERIAAEQQPAR